MNKEGFLSSVEPTDPPDINPPSPEPDPNQPVEPTKRDIPASAGDNLGDPGLEETYDWPQSA